MTKEGIKSCLGYALACGLLAMSAGMPVAAQSTGFDDHGDEPATASNLSLGESATGELYPKSDRDYFRLELTGETTLVVSHRGDDKFASRLEHSDGTCVAALYSGGQSERNDVGEGTYFLRVGSYFGLSTGSYEIAVLEVGPDDHGNSAATATEVALGDMAAGVIDAAGDTDFFRLELPERTMVMVTGMGLQADSAAPGCGSNRFGFQATLSTGDGEPYQKRSELAAGTHILRVGSNGLTGAYEITVLGIDADDHGDSFTTATPIALGEVVAGDIGPSGDDDYFRLDLPRATEVTVSAQADAGIGLETVDAETWQRVDAVVDPQGGLRLREELHAGSHYLRVGGPGDRTGSYELVARETAPDDHGNNWDTATPLGLGTTKAGYMDVDDDVDCFRLDLKRPTDVILTATGNFAGLDVYGDGALLAGMRPADDLDRLGLRDELDAGTYYLCVTTMDNQLGPYDVGANEVGPDDHGNRPETATAVPLGTAAEGVIELAHDCRLLPPGPGRSLGCRGVCDG